MDSRMFHVLNLERRVDRRELFEATNGEISGLEFEFVKAVDGRKLEVARLQAAGLLAPGTTYRAGHLGCALGHLNLCRQAVSDGVNLFVCEDDAIFRRDFSDQLQLIEKQLPEDWDIVLFGYNLDSAVTMELIPGLQNFNSQFDRQPILVESIPRFQSIKQSIMLARLTNAFGMPAYAVSAQGAAKILRDCLPLRRVEVYLPCLQRRIVTFSIDSLANAFYGQWNSFATFPPMVIALNDTNNSDTKKPD